MKCITLLLLMLLSQLALSDTTVPSQVLLLPTDSGGSHFGPYTWHLQDREEFRVEMVEAGYIINTAYICNLNPNEILDWEPTILLEDAEAEYGSGYGVFLHHGHGNILGPGVMQFRHDQEALWLLWWQSYQNDPLWRGKTMGGTVIDGDGLKVYVLGPTWAAVREQAFFSNGIVHMQTCDGSAVGENLFGALYTMGPVGTCTYSDSQYNVSEFWVRMGREQKDFDDKPEDFWACAAIAHCPNLIAVGNSWDYTGAQPGFLRNSLGMDENDNPINWVAIPPGGQGGWGWVFDSQVYQESQANLLLNMSYSTFLPLSVDWTITNDGFPQANINVSAYTGATEGAEYAYLDGAGIHAVGSPEVGIEDDGQQIFCFLDANPAAEVHRFTVVDGQAVITLGGAYNTQEFIINGSTSDQGPWTEIARVTPTGEHELRVGVSLHAFYQLQELETSGNVRNHRVVPGGAWMNVTTIQVPDRSEVLNVLAQRQQELMLEMNQTSAPADMESPIKCVVYVKDAWLDIADYYKWGVESDYDHNITVELVPISQVSNLKADMQSRAGNGVTHFEIHSPAKLVDEYLAPWTTENGWAAIQDQYHGWGYPVGEEFNDIPTISESDTRARLIGDGYFGPYTYTDWAYLDFDNDGWPESGLKLSRVPFSDDGLYGLWVEKDMVKRGPSFQYQSGPNTQFLIGDGNHASDYDGTFQAEKIGMSNMELARQWIPESYIRGPYRESEQPSDYLRTREAQDFFLDRWADLIWVDASWSNRYYPGNFFYQQYMDMSSFNGYGSTLPVLVILSCGSVNFAWQESDLMGRPLFERLMGLRLDGPVAVVGIAEEGSRAKENQKFGNNLMRNMGQQIFMGDAVSMTIQDIKTLNPSDEQARVNALKVHLLGSTLAEIHVSHKGQVSGVPSALNNLELSNYPNPFNPATQIEYNLPRQGRVNLSVYDLRGRLVKQLVESQQGAGYHKEVWDGTDSHGASVASGIYFAKLSIEGENSLVQKMSLIK